MADERLLLGEIVAAHGIKGLVKVRSFTEAPEDIVAYGPLRDGAGRPVELSGQCSFGQVHRHEFLGHPDAPGNEDHQGSGGEVAG